MALFLARENKDGKKQQVFMISEGKAHVMKLFYPIVNFDEDPDIKAVASEPHTFQPDSKKVMELILNDSPITEIKKTVQKTITITHIQEQ